jgi:hypothetical protein
MGVDSKPPATIAATEYWLSKPQHNVFFNNMVQSIITLLEFQSKAFAFHDGALLVDLHVFLECHDQLIICISFCSLLGSPDLLVSGEWLKTLLPSEAVILVNRSGSSSKILIHRLRCGLF